MAPLSCCDLTSLDETVQLTPFPFSRPGLVEASTSSYDDATSCEKASLDSTANYWDWPSVVHVRHDTMIDLFSGSYLERNLKATAAKFNKQTEEAECTPSETHSTERTTGSSSIRGPLVGPCYWDWSSDTGSLKQATNIPNSEMNLTTGSRKLHSAAWQDDPTSLEYFNWPPRCRSGSRRHCKLDKREVARLKVSAEKIMGEHHRSLEESSVQKTISEKYWMWSHHATSVL